MNVSLPAKLREFVDTRVREGSYGSAGEYVNDLIRRDRDRRRLRAILQDTVGSPQKTIGDRRCIGWTTPTLPKVRTSEL